VKHVNITIDRTLHSKAKALAAIRGVSLNDYLSLAIEKSISKQKKLFEALK
jgi:predicted HicB family RNase H-like nuclease